MTLTQEKYVLFDDEDLDKVSQYRWYAFWDGFNWYARTNNNGKSLVMHRIIMDALPTDTVDHKKHYSDHIDNRKNNLRICTLAENSFNRRKQKLYRGKKVTSFYKGVSRDKSFGGWMARITKNNKQIFLGSFKFEIDAAEAYDKAALELFGEFANINEV